MGSVTSGRRASKCDIAKIAAERPASLPGLLGSWLLVLLLPIAQA